MDGEAFAQVQRIVTDDPSWEPAALRRLVMIGCLLGRGEGADEDADD